MIFLADEYLSVAVHNEFAQRIEAEERRQNARIEKLEQVVDSIQELTVSVKTMASSIEHLTAEVRQQGDKLEALEAEPGKKWQRLIDGIIGAIAGLVGSGIIYAIITNMR